MLLQIWIMLAVFGILTQIVGLIYHKMVGKITLLLMSIVFLATTAIYSLSIEIIKIGTGVAGVPFSTHQYVSIPMAYFFSFLAVLSMILSIYYGSTSATRSISEHKDITELDED